MNSAAAALVAATLGAGPALAAGDVPKPPKQDWSFNGLFGTFDRASAQRGLQVYREVCAACHSLRLVHFRQLAGIGYDETQIKAMAAQIDVTDGPNDAGEMFERKGLPADKFPSPFANAKAAAASNNGKAPPDLSLMTKARLGGADYVFGLLTGYGPAPAGVEVPEGGNYNAYFPGHVIAMAAPLNADGVEYQDGTKASVEQMARDVTTFLAWTAEPELEARKAMGIKVLLFLIILTGLLYGVKRKIWEDVH
ncbi:MAG: cytochrome c1 [Rhodospirillaceae bacterium]